ncbi:MAG: ribonuclease P protein component [Desulfatibacillaceae bacterium]|nr:ribonuclease P protein component [Desulfatibacillaceae bacterium]
MERHFFAKESRLKKRSQFLDLSSRGKRVQNSLFIAVYDSSLAHCPRLGITVTKKVGNAWVRNRIKRRVREFFRQNRHLLPQALDINIIAKKMAADADHESCRKALESLFGRIAKGASP